MSERPTWIKRIRRPLGRIRRWVKRTWWNRLTGRAYRAWLAAGLQAGQVERVGSVDNQIPIAVIVPVFNPPVDFLRECLASVTGQQARNWQLIVVDDGSSDLEVTKYLDAFTQQTSHDPRVTVIRSTNGGISAALNTGIEHVTTSHVGWLDHDDLLDPRCIVMFSEVLSASDPDIVYSDEDKVDAKGRHFELYAKPDFSPELLMTQMYLCHFTVFRTSTLREIGGFRSQMDGAQDFDVALRMLPRIASVEHIPLPLYHWRWWPQSTAQSIDAKPWALEATTRVQQEFLDREFGGGQVTPGRVRGLNDVRPRIDGSPLVSVIIPTAGTIDSHSGRRFVDEAIDSLKAHEKLTRIEVIAVTTGDIDPVPLADRTVVYRPTGAFNFSDAINAGREVALGGYLFLLNDDTRAITDNPITTMLELGQISGVGVVGCALVYPDGKLQHAGITLIPSGPTHCWIAQDSHATGYFGSLLTPRNYSAVTAAAMLVRTEAFDATGGFDPTFAKDFNDVDFCLRVRENSWRVAWTPYATFVHHEGASLVRKTPDPTEWRTFNSRHHAALAHDPYYSPALGQSIERLYDVR